MSLEQALEEAGINDPSLSGIERRRAVLQAIDTQLHKTPVITGTELWQAGLAVLDRENYRVDEYFIDNPASANPLLRAPDKFNVTTLPEAIQTYMKTHKPRAQPQSSIEVRYQAEGRPKGIGSKVHNMKLYYKEEEALTEFLKERMSPKPTKVEYTFSLSGINLQ